MDGWSVREAMAADAPALALVGAATFLETFSGVLDGAAIVAHCQRAHSESAYVQALRGGARAWLAMIPPGDAPIGFALMGAADLPGMKNGDLELKRIYVLSRLHGSGIGAALKNAAIDAAEETGAARLLLGVYAQNARAQAFYQRQQFDPIGRRTFVVGDVGYDDVVFARLINSTQPTTLETLL